MVTQTEKCYSVTETATLIRAALSKNFPGIKFSVRSSKFSMGSAIDIHWEFGPSVKEAERIYKVYESKGFDGMTDCSYYLEHWMTPDGTVSLRRTGGGSDPIVNSPAPSEDAVPVNFGGSYVHGSRTYGSYEDSNKLQEQIAKDMCALQKVEWKGPDLTDHLYGEGDQDYAMQYAWRLLNETSFGPLEKYAGVRYATEEERAKDVFLVMVILKEGSKPAAAEIVSSGGIKIRENLEHKGIELVFPDKPTNSVLMQLKASGWRWNHKTCCWYNRMSPETKAFALGIGGQEECRSAVSV